MSGDAARSLLVLRHAKSDWNAGAAQDRLRPLSKRGRRAAEAVGRFVAGAGQVPDLALTSPAVRATETLVLAMKGGGWTCDVAERAGLYDASVEGVLAELRGAPEAARLLLVVGHEPACSALVAALIGGGRGRVPTAALARVDLDAERWREAGSGTGVLAWMVVPALLTGGS